MPLCPPNFLMWILGIWILVLMRSDQCFIHWTISPATKFCTSKSKKTCYLWESIDYEILFVAFFFSPSSILVVNTSPLFQLCVCLPLSFGTVAWYFPSSCYSKAPQKELALQTCTASRTTQAKCQWGAHYSSKELLELAYQSLIQIQQWCVSPFNWYWARMLTV